MNSVMYLVNYVLLDELELELDDDDDLDAQLPLLLLLPLPRVFDDVTTYKRI